MHARWIQRLGIKRWMASAVRTLRMSAANRRRRQYLIRLYTTA